MRGQPVYALRVRRDAGGHPASGAADLNSNSAPYLLNVTLHSTVSLFSGVIEIRTPWPATSPIFISLSPSFADEGLKVPPAGRALIK